jgi:hypothetical protein
MSTEFTDVSGAGSTPPGVVADSAATAAPSADTQASSPSAGHDTTGTDATASHTQGGEAATPEVPDYLKDFPTTEELEQNKSQRYAQALLSIRGPHDALREKHSQLEQQFTPWQPVIERYEKPEEFQSAFETGRGLFTETGERDPETQLPLRTAVPNLLRLGQTSLDDFLTLADGVMNKITFEGRPMWHHAMKEAGLNPENLEQYKQWEREGFSPQVAAGYSDVQQEALKSIPDKFKSAFDKAPPLVKEDLLNMDEETRNYHLEREQRELDRQGAEQKQQQAAQAQFEQSIQTSSLTERTQSFEQSYGQLIEDLKPWQPTGNPSIDSLYHHAVGQLLTNVFDPSMSFSVIPALKEIAPDVDVSTFAQAAEKWDEQRNLANRYEAFNKREQGRYQVEATEARNAADKTFRNLKASMSELAKRVVEYMTKDEAEQKGAELAAQGAQGRPRINGAPNGNSPPPNQGGYNTTWRANFHR